jgi:hypothetical protein
MKAIALFLSLVVAFLLVGTPQKSEAQTYRYLTYSFRNGNFIMKRSTGGTPIPLPVLGLEYRIDTPNITLPDVNNVSPYVNGIFTGIRLLFGNPGPTDTFAGYDRYDFVRLLNQEISAKRGNYIGAYQQSQLFTSDTARVGVYYYDTDSLLYRVRTASGWQSLQPKE